MRKFMVLADSTSDIEKVYRDQYDFDYLKMVFRDKDKEYDADIDWVEMSAKEFYDSMRKGTRFITGLVKATELEEKFKKYLDQGLDVLYIACSSGLSGSGNSGKIFADEILADYPDRKIIVVDALRSCCSQGLMAIKAAKHANDGMDILEVKTILEAERMNYNTIATVGSLEWLRKAGRVKASTAFFGNLFGVKPIIIQDTKGNNYAFKKVKGRKNSLDELIIETKERILYKEEATVFVQHADCLSDAEYVANQIKEQINPKEVIITNVGPIIGASVGPDSIIVNFYGKAVTVAGE